MRKNKVLKWIFLILFIGLISYYFYPETVLPNNVKIDSIILHKSKRELSVYSKGELLKTYTISLGGNPIGDKEFEGDKKTPEGIYYINDKNPNSGYHKNLGISYPNKKDIEEAKKLGKPVGGDVKIHGLRNKTGIINKFHRWFDWTLGCIAVTDYEMDELYEAVDLGTKIEVLP
ncbi:MULTISPECIES: L,D-transpeptidase family protein [Flavobacterium]|uniref:Murein L,D-transpeptidase family protein n=1 Tax=Flavobacterium jumunjinense TaxID=998845 RepID=A0ABV5GLT4_9FLAO|nr:MULTISPECIES: L,D-transpeptidase family protein [Flavobacterium]